MVAIFTGLGAGFERGSGATLGLPGLLGGGSYGRGNEGVSVNAATGNLLISHRDEFLVGRGPDIGISRTYNSQGDIDGGYWRYSTARRVYGFSGTVNTAGSFVSRVSADGSEIVYDWDATAGLYVTTEGGGAHDTLSYTTGVWTWTDGDSGIVEEYKIYGANNWRLSEQRDRNGNTLSFTYSGDDLTRVTTEDGDYIDYVWSGGNIIRIETGYTDLETSTSQTLTRTRYSYDGSGRLETVTVDLTPEDNSVTDNATYVTTYSYDGSSDRVASISQTDGSLVEFEYDTSQRVTRVHQTVAGETRTTKINYVDVDSVSIGDPSGYWTRLWYDTQGQLTRIRYSAPQTNADVLNTYFTYDSDGNVLTVEDGEGAITEYTYDANGNVLTVEDPLGNVTTRTYNADNQVTLETTTGSDADGASVSQHVRYVYDSSARLTYLISAEGHVTEYHYDSTGEMTRVRGFPHHLYDRTSTVPSLATMDAWRDNLAAQDELNLIVIARYEYDARGNLTLHKAYSSATPEGWTNNSDGVKKTHFVYDQAGNLLSRYIAGQEAESFVYDGMNRITASTGVSGATTSYTFNDASTTTVVTMEGDGQGNDYVVTSVYNKAGELISRTDTGDLVAGGAASYEYDTLGRLRVATDATGYKSYFLYDRIGRKLGDINHFGDLTEYQYDDTGRLLATVRYATVISSSDLTTLADPDNTLEIADIRPAAAAEDLWQWSIYDANGRVIQTIEGDGSTTTYAYDASNRLIATTGFANRLTSTAITSFKTTPPETQQLPTASSDDVTTRTFYDRDGNIIGLLNGLGHLSQTVYDGAGRVVQEIAYANAVGSAATVDAAADPFSDLLASITLDATEDISTHYVYDGQGELRYTIDALGRVTELVYFESSVNDAIGLVRKTIRYADTIGTLSAYDMDTVETAITTAMQANGDNRISVSVYNDRGQAVYVIDPIGTVTGFAYDSEGRVIKATQYADLNPQTTVPSESTMDSWAASHGAGARITRTYYNDRGEAVYAIDAEGYVSGSEYDEEGRLTKTLRWSAAQTPTDGWTTATVDAAAKGTSVDTLYEYDAAGRLSSTYAADGTRTYAGYYATGQKAWEIRAYGQGSEESRVKFVYDEAGRLQEQIQYLSEVEAYESLGTHAFIIAGGERLVSGNGEYTALLTKTGELRIYYRSELIWTSGSHEEHPGATYRLIAETDGNLVIYREGVGAQSGAIWDAQTSGSHSGSTFVVMHNNGGFALRKGTNPGDATGLIWGAGTALADLSGYSTHSVSTTYEYDGFGRLATMTDAEGGETSFTYDKAGQVLTRTDAEDGVTGFEYDAFGQVTTVTDACGNDTVSAYDQAGRVIETIDALGHYTQTDYTVFGEVDEVRREFAAATAGYTTTSYTYDKLGRMTGMTDARGNSESYVLNAFGERESVTNRLGGVTLYEYDDRGLLQRERVQQAVYDENGDPVQIGGVDVTEVVTYYQYDSRGNMVSMTEAEGLDEARVTTYVYDSLDRLIETHGESRAVYDHYADTGASNTPPVETVAYDRRGNVIRTADATGAETLYWYDAASRLIGVLSPLGTFTRHYHDGNGNVVETRVYETPVTGTVDPAGALPVADGWDPLLSGGYRVTTFVYDDLNRLVESRVPAIETAAYGTSFGVTTPDLVTAYEYDEAGNVVKVTDPNGGETFYYYDELGRKTAQVDAGLYLTEWDYDEAGNVTGETRWATQLGSAPTTAAPPSPPSPSADDRETVYVYDAMGNREREERQGVKYHNGTGGHATGTAVIAYSYNALGQVLTKTEATGDVTGYVYDDSGRVVSESRETYVDYDDANVTPTVDYYYNGLNDLARSVQAGTSGAAARITEYVYDGAGRLATMTDAAGFVRTYAYDIAGRVVREEYTRVTPDGSSDEAVAYRYDAEGRVIETGVIVYDDLNSKWSGGALDPDASTNPNLTVDMATTEYNAFGEVAAQGINGENHQTFDYDAAGRVWRTTAGTGVPQFFMYDANGNRTLAITGAGQNTADLSGLADMAAVRALWTSDAAIATTGVAGVAATITRYDARNQAVEVLEPQRELTQNANDDTDLVTVREYNAFGEVSREELTNAQYAHEAIEYSYNTMGRVIEIKSPQVSVTNEDGTSGNVRPTEHRYYDLSGRLVATKDANGNLTKMTLLAGTGYGGTQALTAAVTYADGGVVTMGYDILGNEREITDQLGRITTKTWDAMGRVTQIDQKGGLVDHYTYDGLGQQITHWNNEFGSGNVETTEYDQQGRVITQAAFGGDETTHAYTWDAAIETDLQGTSSDWTFGGWQQVTTFENGRTLTVETDQFSREVSRNDLGSNTIAYEYDYAGQAVYRNGTGTEVQNYIYFNTGRLASAGGSTSNIVNGQTVWTDLNVYYGYDAVGNLLEESLVEEGERWEVVDLGGYYGADLVPYDHVIKEASATYDALGRMLSWSEAGDTTADDEISPTASRSFLYDANGNIRKSVATFMTLDEHGEETGSPVTKEYWYRYDAMNRIVTAKGELDNGVIVRGLNGIDIEYNDAGERTVTWQSFDVYTTVNIGGPGGMQTIYVDYTGIEQESYSYDDAGRVIEVRIGKSDHTIDYQNYTYTVTHPGAPANDDVRSTITYDLMGRMETQLDLYESLSDAYEKTISYDSSGRTLDETVITTRGGHFYRTETEYDYDTGGYALGAAKVVTTDVFEEDEGAQGTIDYTTKTANDYDWWNGATLDLTTYTPDTSSPGTTHTTEYYYSKGGHLQQAFIDDGRKRYVTFTMDTNGQAIRRDERDFSTSTSGDPHEVWYRFGGKEMGYTGNNGTLNTDHEVSIAARTAAPGTGPFRNGASTHASHIEFDQAYEAINSYQQGSEAGSYTVRRGDTLAGIAASLWGDASLWYRLAEANGLSGQSGLIEGRSLVLPAGVMRSTYNADTLKPYDPAAVQGDLNPTTPVPPKPEAAQGNKCGTFGQVLLVAVAVAVTAATGNVLAGIETFKTLGAIGGIITGAASAAAGSVASQAVGVATGIQEKFSWNAVALAAISGGVGGGISARFGAAQSWQGAAVRGVAGSALSQGTGVATGLQDSFSWVGVAGAGVGAATGYGVGSQLNASVRGITDSTILGEIAGGAASAVANAATRTALDGSSFGDNLRAAIPDVIGSALGNALGGAFSPGGGVGSLPEFVADNPVNREVGDGLNTQHVVSSASVEGDIIVINGTRVRSSDYDSFTDYISSWTQHMGERFASQAGGQVTRIPSGHELTLAASSLAASNRHLASTLSSPWAGVQEDWIAGQGRLQAGVLAAYDARVTAEADRFAARKAELREAMDMVGLNAGDGLFTELLKTGRYLAGQYSMATYNSVVTGVEFLANNAIKSVGLNWNIATAQGDNILEKVWNGAIDTYSVDGLINTPKFTVDSEIQLATDIVLAAVAPEALIGKAGAIGKAFSKAPACFVAGTLVHAKSGLTPIEQIQVGDFVWSRSEHDEGEPTWRKVLNTVIHEDRDIWSVAVSTADGRSEVYLATPDHPFWIEDEEQGWTAAEYLKPGQKLRLADGSPAYVAEIRATGETDTVYNFEVEGFHTYHVGKFGIWVHNTNCAEINRNIVRKILYEKMGPAPDGMYQPHAHHILPLKGYSGVQDVVAEGHRVLKRYDIDSVYGPENLTWAPNGRNVHSNQAVQKLVYDLKQADISGSKVDIVDTLTRHGAIAYRKGF